MNTLSRFLVARFSLDLWRQLLMHQMTAYLLKHLHSAISLIPPHTKFPINTPSNDASSLSWYPRIQWSTTTCHTRTHDISWFLVHSLSDCFMFLCKYINAFYKFNETPWYICLIEDWLTSYGVTQSASDHLIFPGFDPGK